MRKIFLNTIQKISAETFTPLPRNRKKTKNISLTYDVNDHVYFQVKIRLYS